MKNSLQLSAVVLGAGLLILTSCGKESSSSSSSRSMIEEESDPGIYRAVLSPLNSSVSGLTSGTIEIKIDGDDFIAKSNVTGSPAGVKHLQNIMVAKSCPTEAADKNADGLIDASEAMVVAGQFLLPLDSNLNDQFNGLSFGPIANASGIYSYRRSTTLSALMSDLHAPDPDPLDAFVKLKTGQDLKLAGRVIIIHGVDSSSKLPETVATVGDLSAEQSLPIACGKIQRILNEGSSERPRPTVTPVEATEATPVTETESSSTN